MITFSELYSDLNEFKVLSKGQRKKIGIRMKRQAQSSAFKTKVAKSKLKVASPEKIKVKAAKLAKQSVLNKFYPKYNEMPVAQKVKIDQIIAVKYGGMINKIAMKSVKVVKAKEIAKVKSARDAKSDA
jgi:hypothetical protein|tara:strand:+ start:131 stop:514 length:384 start_codon:yes stop_codon:yes gene_type:complete